MGLLLVGSFPNNILYGTLYNLKITHSLFSAELTLVSCQTIAVIPGCLSSKYLIVKKYIFVLPEVSFAFVCSTEFDQTNIYC